MIPIRIGLEDNRFPGHIRVAQHLQYENGIGQGQTPKPSTSPADIIPAPAGAVPKKVKEDIIRPVTSREGLRQRGPGNVYGFGKPSMAFSARWISSSGS